METQSKKNKNKKLQDAAQQAGDISKQVLFGDIVSSKFFSKYKFTIIIGVLLILAYITFKYECQTHMEKIAILEKELSIVKSESIREQATYKSRTRESMMQAQIDSLHLALRPQEQPPFILSYD